MPNKSILEKMFHDKEEDCLIEACDERLRRVMQCQCGQDVLRCWLKYQIENKFSDQNKYLWTLCLPRDEVSSKMLNAFKVHNSKRSIARIVNRLKIPGFKAIGFLDIQLQEYSGYIPPLPHSWDIHYHFLIISHLSIDYIRRRMRKVFQIKRRHAKPSVIKPTTTEDFNFGYLLKYSCERKKKLRIQFIGQIPFQMRIKGVRRQELTTFLAANHLLKFIFLIGMRRSSSRLIVLNCS